MPSRADRTYQEVPGLTRHSRSLPSSTRHSPELGIVTQDVATSNRSVPGLQFCNLHNRVVSHTQTRSPGLHVVNNLTISVPGLQFCNLHIEVVSIKTNHRLAGLAIRQLALSFLNLLSITCTLCLSDSLHKFQ